MSHEERNTIVAIIANLVVVIFWGSRIWGMYGDGVFDGPDGLMEWARTVLWMIPTSIAVTIIATILFNIFFAIATRDGDPDFTVDERDRSIGIKGLRVTIVIASAGFIAGLIGLAVGWTPFTVLNIILVGFALGDLLGSLTRLTLYRMGA